VLAAHQIDRQISGVGVLGRGQIAHRGDRVAQFQPGACPFAQHGRSLLGGKLAALKRFSAKLDRQLEREDRIAHGGLAASHRGFLAAGRRGPDDQGGQ
jgi:hypothetical protein